MAQQPTPLILDAPGMPTIRAVGVDLRVHAYIAGRTRAFSRPGAQILSPGCPEGASDLWYLSLVADSSEATALEGVWSYLADRSATSAYLFDPTKPNGGSAMVSLGRHRQDLAALGWRPHYRWLTDAIEGTESLHGVLEPLELTASGSAQQVRGKAARRVGAADPAALEKEVKEEQARQSAPLFLLTAQPQDEPEKRERSRRLARFHLRFLAERVNWLAYHEPYEQFLWERAWAEREVEELYTFCFTEESQRPYLAGAFLCRPNLLKLDGQLRSAIQRGVFGRPALTGRGEG